ncbi:MAG TPA: glycosyltransferase [Bryobacteraceae bacterium]|nr:glycosyltransferase [Bryobacteraceae bacterium]
MSCRIDFYCGRSQETWSPLSVNTGIGGSQESLMALAAALQQLGNTVRIYNTCGSAAGEYSGVVFEDYRAFGRRTPGDVVVVWRFPWNAEAVPPDTLTYLWMKDMIRPQAVMQAAHRYSKIFIQSRFHRRYYPDLQEDKFVYTRNGIVLQHFDQRVERDPYKVVYGSSYDRGLLQLLESWPRIQAKVPQAHLTVFYGFDSSRAHAFQLIRPSLESYRRQNPIKFWGYRRFILAALRQANAEHLGRIGHWEVARQFLSAGIWAYPTAFSETSCITAMKAQAAGAIPVVIPSGAVDETVQFGAKTSTSANDYPDRRVPPQVYEEWEALLISHLQNPAKLEQLRAEMAPAARERFAWETVARQWSAEFQRALGRR